MCDVPGIPFRGIRKSVVSFSCSVCMESQLKILPHLASLLFIYLFIGYKGGFQYITDN